ncbi:hypothetical protein Q7C36_012250 [Tachysurus vachellii]|uniref:Uncharacterized protein n=1 Tax=Tachysurus vachellii TaxID=175792 RepID=A0AA88MPR6_TACVA|nr:hypothetical protein Q7C36_012250 [Tachysurus vachellii]
MFHTLEPASRFSNTTAYAIPTRPRNIARAPKSLNHKQPVGKCLWIVQSTSGLFEACRDTSCGYTGRTLKDSVIEIPAGLSVCPLTDLCSL